MHLQEPFATALFLTASGLLLASATLSTRAAGRVGIPVTLLFLGIGMLAGAQGLAHLSFTNYGLTFRVGTVALVLILFDGGLNTPLAQVREGLAPAAVLATVGVVGTALLGGLAAHVLGAAWPVALLFGAIISSTDAAAVFSVLRLTGLQVKRRVGMTLELESGLNDPMAVILTATLTQALLSGKAPHLGALVPAAVQMALGGGVGVGVGLLGRGLLERARLAAAGLYPVLSVSLALLSFGLATLVGGSGFLAVYVAGVLVGSGRIRYRHGILRVHDAIAWLGQVCMFLLLGLLVSPAGLWQVAGRGVLLALLLTLVARPLVVLACLAPFRFPWRQALYIGWVGLRGAVPIILATIPVLAGVPGARALFTLVFFIVIMNALVPGMTVGWATRRLGLVSGAPPPPHAVLELASTRLFRQELSSFYVSPAAAVSGVRVQDLPLPESAVLTLIVRGEELVGPKGQTELAAGDHVYVFCEPQDLPLLTLMFGQEEEP